MRVLIDENIPLMTAQALRDLGHDVLDIRGTSDQGMTDKSLWELAQEQERLLITTDKGFAQRRDELHYGMKNESNSSPTTRATVLEASMTGRRVACLTVRLWAWV
jgi:uncharacterized protein with PIN domain